MHDREKSHSAIVAAKPTNKAGAPAAEPVEPRAGTKRHAGGQSTHRTQGWVRVTQALERVRQAARLRKDEKFTALFHHFSVDLFREAFFALKRDAGPTRQTLNETSLICTHGFMGEHIGHCHRVERTYQRPMGNSARWRSRRSRTRSSRKRPLPC